MTAVDPAVVYLITAGIIVATLVIISFFCGGGRSEKKNDGAREVRRQAVVREENVPAGGRARRRAGPRRNRMQIAEHDWEADGPPDIGDDDDGDDEGLMDDIDLPEGKVGAKKLRKLQDKAEKKRMREIELQEREEKKEREKKLEEQRKREEEKRKAAEAIEAEEARLQKEEKERQEHEEYLKLKEAFTVEEEGETEQTGDLDVQSLLQQFIDHIKEMKVVMLEDLAAHFKLKTQDCINRIQDLQAEGRLTGVIDDRGKFIYITMEELEAVAKYMRNIGRVSISELAESSNRLINLNPDNTEIQKKLIVGDNANVLVEAV